MVVDYRYAPHVAKLFQIVEIATGKALDGPIWYADDDCYIYRQYDSGVGQLSEVVRFGGPAWTEYYCPIRIEPRPDLSAADRLAAAFAIRQHRETATQC